MCISPQKPKPITGKSLSFSKQKQWSKSKKQQPHSWTSYTALGDVTLNDPKKKEERVKTQIKLLVFNRKFFNETTGKKNI